MAKLQIGNIDINKGVKGDNGIDGNDGLSAYQIAVNGGFVGDETAWLASLQGEQGIQGVAGVAGADGADAGIGKWDGKSIGLFGDSLMEGASFGNFQTQIETKTGATCTNFGSSGANAGRLVGIMTPIKDRDAVQPSTEPDYTLFDAIVIMIGTNFDASGYGTIADIPTDSYLDIPATYADETTYLNTFPDKFYSNVGMCIEYVKEHNENCRIYLVTPPYETTGDSKTLRDHIIAIGEHYSIPVINAIDNAGLEEKQWLKYSYDGTHFNTLGNEIWGNYIGEQLNSQ
jgi:lysophospholipase L1-like esterase